MKRHDTEKPRTTRRIPVADLRIGMFVTSVDQSWFKSPFLRHKFLVHSPEQIEKLRRAGVGQVTIDLTRGCDMDTTKAGPPLAVTAPARPLHATFEEVAAHSASHPLRDLQQEFISAQRARERLAHTVRRIYDEMQSSGTIDPSEATEAVREITIVTRTLTDPAVFMAMSQARDADPALSTHALVTCALSLIIGQGTSLDLTDMQDLAAGALLHDIGLIGIPAKVLGRLRNTSVMTPHKDLELYQSHPRHGAIRIERKGRFPLHVRQIIAEHHALPNGTGFPREADPSGTSRLSRIVMIADRYDDLLTGFGGATPLQPHDAIQRLYLESQEGALDQNLTRLFIRRVGVFPIYSMVMLNTGERAVVTEINEEALHLPVIHVTHSPTGQILRALTRVDLARQEQDQPARSVSRVLDSTNPKSLGPP